MKLHKAGAICATLLLLLSCVAGCGPAGALAPFFNDDDGGGGGSTFVFQLPDDGSVVDQAVTLSVSEPEINGAQFLIDDRLMFADTSEPYEWVLDPKNLVLGTRKVTVIGFSSSAGSLARNTNVTIERSVPLSEIEAEIANLAPSHWYEIPNTRLRAVGYYNAADYRGNLVQVMDAASGGTYDTKRDRLIVFGGGQTYSGNELYAFDLATARWIRLTEPSEFDPNDPGNSLNKTSFPDGSPMARHTYDFVEYLPPPIDRLYVGGGSSVWPNSNLSDDQTWYFDFDLEAWDVAATGMLSAGTGSVAAVDGSGLVWQQGSGGNRPLSRYDPSTSTWTTHFEHDGWFANSCTADIDTARRLFVSVGDGVTRLWDLDNPDDASVVASTTGDTEIQFAVRPGVAYHPGTGKIVAWGGGKATYTFDLDSETWTRIASSGDVDPGPQNGRGTQGRFRYVPSRNIFIVVSSVDTNVFVYRLPES